MYSLGPNLACNFEHKIGKNLTLCIVRFKIDCLGNLQSWNVKTLNYDEKKISK